MTLPDGERLAYATAEPEERYRLASLHPRQGRVVAEQLVEQHRGEPTLVIGQYLDQLDELGRAARRPGDQGRDAGQGARSGSTRRSGPARSTCSWSARSRTSPSTCPTAAVAIQVSRLVRLPPGGGAAPRPAAAAEGRRPDGAVLHDRLARHRRRRLRPEPAAVPRRAGLRLPDRRRRRPPDSGYCGGPAIASVRKGALARTRRAKGHPGVAFHQLCPQRVRHPARVCDPGR